MYLRIKFCRHMYLNLRLRYNYFRFGQTNVRRIGCYFDYHSNRRVMSRLYHSLEWYTRVYTTRDYGITLFHNRRDRANRGLRLAQ